MLVSIHEAVRTSLSATTEIFREALAHAVRDFRDIFRGRVLTILPASPESTPDAGRRTPDAGRRTPDAGRPTRVWASA